ncbi:MAG: hypothetical protein R3B70_03065 [Polyangiaceae bacterium]
MTRPSSPGKTPPSAPEPEEAKGGDSEPAAPAEDSGKKERVLHTRVPAVLERELKRFAENLRVPVSNLVRAILEDAVAAADAASESVEGRLTRAAEEIGKGRGAAEEARDARPAVRRVRLPAGHARTARELRAVRYGALAGRARPPRDDRYAAENPARSALRVRGVPPSRMNFIRPLDA